MAEKISAPNGQVIWITGLSGAGKSTLATKLGKALRQLGSTVVILDGDELREVFGATSYHALNHGRPARLALAMQYAHLCRVIASQGVTVIIATISLFKEVHAWNRAHLPGYFEAYLKVPLDELRRRDPKGIYRRFEEGTLRDVAGLDLEIDEPEAPDWMVNYSPDTTVSTLSEQLMSALHNRKKYD